MIFYISGLCSCVGLVCSVFGDSYRVCLMLVFSVWVGLWVRGLVVKVNCMNGVLFGVVYW